ncbi:hypothetical protein R1A27_28655 [Methylobacterium sp. NMS12]|uniref:hypothetical protein n=1 Tax=Methylobacterium sp. NMS12 TaxID=3079766 RepID=UPI003F88036A
MAEPITMETLQAGRLQHAGHGDAKDWFADFWQHTTIRRLSVADRAPRRGRVPKSPAMGRIWQVDGADCASLDEAIKRLNVPPVLTAAEGGFLERVPAEWTEFRGFLALMKGEEFGPDCSAYGMVHALQHKGLVEVERWEDKKASFIRRVPITEAAE